VQLDLFEGDELDAASVWQTRDFEGFHQAREGNSGTWCFRVTGFDDTSSGTPGYCYVLRADGTTKKVAIDAQDRITVAGKKYGREHWTH